MATPRLKRMRSDSVQQPSSLSCSTVCSSTCTLSGTSSRRSSGCLHCLDCAAARGSALTWQKAARIRSANATDEWREWWPAGLSTPTYYFYLRQRQLRYLQLNPNRDAEALWRAFPECNYSAAPLLLHRGCSQLAVHVPAAVTGLDSQEDLGAAVQFMGSKLVVLRPWEAPLLAKQRQQGTTAGPAGVPAQPQQILKALHRRQQQHAAAAAVEEAAPVPPPPPMTHHRQGPIPAPAAAAPLQTPVAVALAAAKRLAAAAAAAASVPYAPRGSSSSLLHRVPRCLDVPLLSPAGSSCDLSVASSSGSLGASSLLQLAPQGSPLSPLADGLAMYPAAAGAVPHGPPHTVLTFSSLPPLPAMPMLPPPPPQQQRRDQAAACAGGCGGTRLDLGQLLPKPRCACSAASRLLQQQQHCDCCGQRAAPALQQQGLGLYVPPPAHFHVAVS